MLDAGVSQLIKRIHSVALPPVQILDHLLRAKRNRHADDDDSDLTDELAPAATGTALVHAPRLS